VRRLLAVPRITDQETLLNYGFGVPRLRLRSASRVASMTVGQGSATVDLFSVVLQADASDVSRSVSNTSLLPQA
jgi:hypothetical protein